MMWQKGLWALRPLRCQTHIVYINLGLDNSPLIGENEAERWLTIAKMCAASCIMCLVAPVATTTREIEEYDRGRSGRCK